jgi:hypothetical protein
MRIDLAWNMGVGHRILNKWGPKPGTEPEANLKGDKAILIIACDLDEGS